jgi:hypothetical protein
LPDADRDELRAVREHLDEAHAAADRLVRDAQRQAEDAHAARAAGVPPRGWESAREEPPRAPDLQALLGLLDAVRETVPGEISRPLAEALRDLLLALRALIDWYLERVGEPAPGGSAVEVEDIPLD